GEGTAVHLSARDLVRDIAEVTGRQPALVLTGAPPPGAIAIATASTPAAAAVLASGGIDPAALEGRWEHFAIRPGTGLTVAGSDERGTLFGVYEVSRRYFGVDPIAQWTGLPAAKRARVMVTDDGVAPSGPEFRFRGWFLNDEDLITGWHLSPGRRRLVHYYFHRPIAMEVYEKVFETALRLRCNLIIPGSYIDLEAECDRRIVEAAQRRGLFVSQHHTQPLGVSAFCFHNHWRDRGESPEFSYAKNPEAMEEVWRHYAGLWARYPNVVWQLGLRGAGDRAFWAADRDAPKTDAERGALVSRAIARQWGMVRAATGATPPATATLWAEGSALHAKGHLAFPDGVSVVFADEGATQEMQADFREIAREPGRRYGVYYHAAFWGAGPRLVQGVPLDKIARTYAAIAAKGDTFLSILNVGSIREVILQTEAVSDLTWSGRGFAPDAYLRRWCAREFGEPCADETAAAYRSFFAAFVPISTNGALMLDGVPRFAGKGLLATALDRDTFPAYAGRAELDKTLDRYQPLAAASAQNFRRVVEEAQPLLERIDPARRPFFADNLLVQAETMAGLGLWLEELCQGMRAFTSIEVGRAAAHAGRAADALGRVLDYRKRAEWGPWANWYRGDWRMNLPALHEDTRRLAETWTGLAELEKKP
ncbi:MAG: glycosyl hydrolase 115 family protein, partial [Verrucomicrobia bacterium]|nr:glycosyl hydrolase 115 family protein [Verrucomicrobiota bacterium]